MLAGSVSSLPKAAPAELQQIINDIIAKDTIEHRSRFRYKDIEYKIKCTPKKVLITSGSQRLEFCENEANNNTTAFKLSWFKPLFKHFIKIPQRGWIWNDMARYEDSNPLDEESLL